MSKTKPMKKLLVILPLLVFSAVFCHAQERKLGLFSSPDGFGVSYDRIKAEDQFLSFTAYLNCFDRMFGNGGGVGASFNFSRNFILKQWKGNAMLTSIYAGPGISAGYVRDYQENYPGIMAAASCNIGARFLFNRGIAVDLSFGAAAGFHLNIHSDTAPPVLSVYKRGLMHIPFPQLKIMFPLK